MKDKSEVVERNFRTGNYITNFFNICKSMRSFTVNSLNIRTDKLRIDVTTAQTWYGRTPLSDKKYLECTFSPHFLDFESGLIQIP